MPPPLSCTTRSRSSSRCADWEDIERWQLGPDAEHPQLELASEDIVFVADTATTTFEIRNVGCTAMTVTGLEADVEGYDVLLADTEVAVGGSIEGALGAVRAHMRARTRLGLRKCAAPVVVRFPVTSARD